MVSWSRHRLIDLETGKWKILKREFIQRLAIKVSSVILTPKLLVTSSDVSIFPE